MTGFNLHSARLHEEISLDLLETEIFFTVFSVYEVHHLNAERVVWQQSIGKIEGDCVLCFCPVISRLK